jgi:exodeoxyribonuclease III
MNLKQKKTTELRIASYNILKGGKKQTNRIFKIVQEINPDICGILEAVEWQNNKKYYKKNINNLGYKFFDVALANSKYNIAIFSKIPITIKTFKNGIKHVVLKATIKSGPFKDFRIFFVHLSPVSENERLLEIKKVLKNIKKSGKVIIIGDFNSLSSHDPYNKKKLIEIFKKNKITKYGTNKLHFDVIQEIESSGLVDVSNHLKNNFVSTTPTSSNKDMNHIANIRIDYAFSTKNVLKYFKKIEILKNDASNKASDHYPLFIELQK